MQVAIAAADTWQDSDAPALSGQYTTALGEVGFDVKGDLAASPYRIFRYDGARFVPLESQ